VGVAIKPSEEEIQNAIKLEGKRGGGENAGITLAYYYSLLRKIHALEVFLENRLGINPEDIYKEKL